MSYPTDEALVVTADCHFAAGARARVLAAMERVIPRVHEGAGGNLYAIQEAEDGTITSRRSLPGLAASGLRVRSVNGDIGDFNDPDADEVVRAEHLDRIAYALATAADAARDHGVQLWLESLHILRFSWAAGAPTHCAPDSTPSASCSTSPTSAPPVTTGPPRSPPSAVGPPTCTRTTRCRATSAARSTRPRARPTLAPPSVRWTISATPAASPSSSPRAPMSTVPRRSPAATRRAALTAVADRPLTPLRDAMAAPQPAL